MYRFLADPLRARYKHLKGVMLQQNKVGLCVVHTSQGRASKGKL
jgi:hypothetical protein